MHIAGNPRVYDRFHGHLVEPNILFLTCHNFRTTRCRREKCQPVCECEGYQLAFVNIRAEEGSVGYSE